MQEEREPQRSKVLAVSPSAVRFSVPQPGVPQSTVVSVKVSEAGRPLTRETSVERSKRNRGVDRLCSEPAIGTPSIQELRTSMRQNPELLSAMLLVQGLHTVVIPHALPQVII